MPDLDEAELNLGRFYDLPENELRDKNNMIDGDYQLYARSNILPDYLWLGRMTFTTIENTGNSCLHVEVVSHHQEIENRSYKEFHSEGHGAPCGDRNYQVVLRSKYERGDETGALCIIRRLNLPHENKIDQLRVHAIQYESEKDYIMKNIWPLVRRHNNDIECGFVSISEIYNDLIAEELCLK